MKIKILGLITAGIMCLSLLAFGLPGGPKSYEDCILQNMKDAQNKTAATLIRNACLAKFSGGPAPPRTPVEFIPGKESYTTEELFGSR